MTEDKELWARIGWDELIITSKTGMLTIKIPLSEKDMRILVDDLQFRLNSFSHPVTK